MREQKFKSQLNPVLHEIWLVTLFVKRPSYLLIYLIFQQKVANSSLSSFSNETPGYATLQPTLPSEDGGDYSKLELWISKNCIYCFFMNKVYDSYLFTIHYLWCLKMNHLDTYMFAWHLAYRNVFENNI